MREVFQKHLLPIGKQTYRIRECQTSARYRQGIRCLLQYTLCLEELGTGGERIQLLTGVMYEKGDKTRRKWEELQRSGQQRVTLPGASAAFEPSFYIPDLEMLVRVFPYDHKLPSLPLLMEGLRPELEPLVLARFGAGDWQVEAWDVEPVRHRYGTSATLRVRVRARDQASHRAEEKRFYAKVYGEEEIGQRTYEVLRELWERAEAGGEGFTVGRPVAYLSDLQTLVQEETPGTSLWDILLLGEDEVYPAMRKAARALATLHLDDVPTKKRWLLSDEVALLKRNQETLGRACPHLRPEIEEVVSAVVAGLGKFSIAPSHGDLHLQHILLDGDRPALIDLDAFGKRNPLLDVAKLLTSLANAPHRSLVSHDLTSASYLSVTHDRAREAARAFAEEYFAHVPKAWRDKFPIYYAGAALKMAGNPLRYLVPGWPNKVEALVKEAGDSLAGKVVW